MNMKSFEFESMQYLIRFPDDFDSQKKYPLIFMLHGSGTRGTDLTPLLGNTIFEETKDMKDFPFVIAAPLCHAETWFDLFETLKRWVFFIMSQDYCDRDHVYLTGYSMGGYGAWQLAMSLPECFAAIVPICGGGMYWNAGRLINVPVWAFHGGKDACVFPEESQKMVHAVNSHGGHAKLTIYPENEHNSWSDTYSNPELYTWLLSHRNQNIKQLSNHFNDKEIYG